MISQLSGTILQASATSFVIDVAGVGYLAHTTPATSAALRPGETSTVHTSLVVREDSLTLYGFGAAEERDAFELVQTASGVGPRLAVAIVSVLSPGRIRQAILAEDLATLCSVPGIGHKGAQKLVLELKDKVLVLSDRDESGVVVAPAPGGEAWRGQVAEGLEGLGWSSRDAASACDRVAHLVEDNPEISVASLMRAALSSLAKR